MHRARFTPELLNVRGCVVPAGLFFVLVLTDDLIDVAEDRGPPCVEARAEAAPPVEDVLERLVELGWSTVRVSGSLCQHQVLVPAVRRWDGEGCGPLWGAEPGG